VFLETGRHEEALACFEQALSLASGNADALFNRGNALRGLQRHDAALDSYDAALRIQPRYLPALVNKGTLLQELGRDEEAIASLERALAIKPDEPGIHLNLGLIQRKLKHYEEALACYDEALALDPRYAGGFHNRSNVLIDLHRYREALASSDRALALNPVYAEALNSRGNALLALDQYEEALASYDNALGIKLDYAEALNNRGLALFALKRYQEALSSYEQALAVSPDYAEAHLGNGVCRLTLGDFAKGWEHYQWRWERPSGKFATRAFSRARWDGEFVDGVLCIRAEQGLGDQILYAGMLEELRQRANRLVVEVDPRLVALFRRSFPGIEILAQGNEAGEVSFDAQVLMASIGQHLRRHWNDFPLRETGYLIPDSARARTLRERMTADGGLVVGLSWASKARRYGEQKSARLRDFEPILRLPGLQFVDLQYGDTLEERASVKDLMGVKVRRLEDVDNFHDIDGLAALITACDAVVTVSNTTAHLAGALGKKMFLLLPYSQGSLWYWHADRDDSPWYPTARLFRQTTAGDWPGTIERVAGELELMVR
jgi:tetratricopeptide (TPR) repeat protein